MTEDDPETPTVAPRRSVSRVVRAWALAGGVAAVTTLVLGLVTGGAVPIALVALCVSAIVLADATELRFDRGATAEYVTLLEVGVVITLLALPMSVVPLTVLAAVVVHHGLIRRRPAAKVAFNAGQHAVAAALASLVVAPFHSPGAPVVGVTILGVALAMSAYALVNSLALGQLFSKLDDTTVTKVLRSRLTLMGSTLLGASVLGILAVGLWQANPVLAPLLASPIAALHLAYRGTARTETLLQEVRIERDRLDRVLAGASEGIVLLDASGTIQLWNPAMEAITGHAVDAAVGRSARDLLAGTDAEGMRIDPLMPLAKGRGGLFEMQVTTSDGAPTVVQMTHTLITDDDGDPLGDVVLVRDLSRERAAHSLKEDFVARVSHELRTPLSPIRGYAQTLLRAGDRVTPEQRHDVLERIVERTDHLERLIEDLLLVSRISSGAIEDVDEVSAEVVDVDALVRRVVDWFERDHRDRAFVITGSFSSSGWCDPLRAGQIVTNLLSNACKYSTAGTPVEVALGEERGMLRIAVRDQSPGIPSDQLETIFDRFQRLEDPQRMTTGGIGLGLYIARHLAERMGGSLEATSVRGTGSTFTLSLRRSTPVSHT